MPMCDPARQLHAVMAGVGDPYAVLSPLRLRILRSLHDQIGLESVAVAVGLSREQLTAELKPLLDAHLVTDVDGFVRANFLVVSAQESAAVDAHSKVVGERLAKQLLDQESALARAYMNLTMSTSCSWPELAFVLVGDRILDVGLLDALAGESTLMPPAPARPSPTNLDAHYYFWMVEGEHDLLGRYGQRANALPWNGWQLLTFGQYTIRDSPIADRINLESAALAFADGDVSRTPADLADFLHLPILNTADSERWRTEVTQVTNNLLAIYQDARESIYDLYTRLDASTYLNDGFGEFFCWYDHLAYAHAIDALANAGMLTIPPQRFSAVIWQEHPTASGF